MNRKKALAKNTFIISIGTFLPKLTSFITLPIVTAGLTQSEYGTYDLILNLVSLVMPFVTLQIQAAAFRFLVDCRGNKEETDKIITNIMCFVGVSSICSLVIVFFCLYKLDFILRILICFYFFIDIIVLSMRQIVRGLSYNKLYSVSAVLQACLDMIFVVVTIKFAKQGLIGLLFSFITALASSVIMLAIGGHIFSHINLKLLSKAKIKELLAYSWPLIPWVLSDWVLRVSDRAVISYFLGIEKTAIYAVANKIPSLLSLVQNTFSYAWQENASIASKDSDQDEYYTSMSDMMSRLLAGFTAVLISMTPVIFAILIKGDYGAAYEQMPILYFGFLFSIFSSFLGGIYVANKRTKNMGVTTTISAVLNIVIDLALINVIGVYAASVSTVVSYLFLVVYRMINIRKYNNIKYDVKKMLLYLCVLIFISFICWINNFYLNILNVVISVVFAYFVNRDLIKNILKKIRKKIKKV